LGIFEKFIHPGQIYISLSVHLGAGLRLRWAASTEKSVVPSTLYLNGREGKMYCFDISDP